MFRTSPRVARLRSKTHVSASGSPSPPQELGRAVEESGKSHERGHRVRLGREGEIITLRMNKARLEA